MASSYLGSADSTNFEPYRLSPVRYNKFRPDHSREWPGDGLDCVQDPHSVLGG